MQASSVRLVGGALRRRARRGSGRSSTSLVVGVPRGLAIARAERMLSELLGARGQRWSSLTPEEWEAAESGFLQEVKRRPLVPVPLDGHERVSSEEFETARFGTARSSACPSIERRACARSRTLPQLISSASSRRACPRSRGRIRARVRSDSEGRSSRTCGRRAFRVRSRGGAHYQTGRYGLGAPSTDSGSRSTC